MLRHVVILLLAANAAAAPSATDLRALLAQSDLHAASLHPSPGGQSAVAVVHTAPVPYRQDFVGLGARILVLIDFRSRTLRALTEASADAHAPAWSPDGTAVACFARDGGAFRLIVLRIATGERRAVASITGEARNPVGEGEIVWSSDGRSVAYTTQPDVPWRERFIDRTAVAPAFLEGPIVIDGTTPDAPLLRSQGMRGPMSGETPKELWTVDVAAHAAPRLMAKVSEGTRLLAFSGDTVLVQSGAAIELLQPEEPPRAMATLEGVIVLAQRTGSASWLLVSRRDAASTLSTLEWRDGRVGVHAVGTTTLRHGLRIAAATRSSLIVVEERGTSDRLATIDARTGTERTLLEDAVVRRAVVTADAILAVTATATKPEMLQLITDGERIPIGHWPGVNAAAYGGVRARVVRWSSNGAVIEGLLLTPSGDDVPKRPLLLFLHGGPESRAVAEARFLHGALGGYAAVFARRGYAVLLPNFRGSTGYGVAFGNDLGNGRLFETPAGDALAGVKKLVDDGLADPRRLGIYGFSYGAMLTAWIVARDHRFRAAVVSAATLDMLADDRRRLRGDRAYHAFASGRAGPEDHLLDHWRAPDKYRELSPLERARDVRTPVLLISTAAEQMAGNDYPAYFNAPRLHDVPVQWAYYPAAWHGGSWSVADRLDAVERMRAWFDRWLTDTTTPATTTPAAARRSVW